MTSKLNIDKEQEYCRKHFNEIGIYGGDSITRLIGYSEDESDCYYILRFLPVWNDDFSGFTNKTVHCSMVGGWYSIKSMGKKGYKYTELNCRIPKADDYTEILLEETLDKTNTL
jgi:hypothetical protein